MFFYLNCIESKTILVENEMAKKKTDEEIKEEIVVAASLLLIKYGYHKTTMEDIAKAVRKGKSTLYYYFKSKEEVTIEVIRREAKYFMQKVSIQISKQSSAVERLKSYFSVVVEESEKTANLYHILKVELVDNFLLQKTIFSYFDEEEIKLIKNILIYGIETKEFDSKIVDKIDDIALLVTHVTKVLMLTLFIEDKKNDWEKMMYLFGDMITKAVQ